MSNHSAITTVAELHECKATVAAGASDDGKYLTVDYNGGNPQTALTTGPSVPHFCTITAIDQDETAGLTMAYLNNGVTVLTTGTINSMWMSAEGALGGSDVIIRHQVGGGGATTAIYTGNSGTAIGNPQEINSDAPSNPGGVAATLPFAVTAGDRIDFLFDTSATPTATPLLLTLAFLVVP